VSSKLDALGDVDDTQPPPHAKLQRLNIDQIDIPRLRIRRDLGEIVELAISLAKFGLLHPLHVYPARGRFRLIAGHRRLAAARQLGWTEIDAFVREASADDLLLELVENTQRKWLTDGEEADALIRLVRGQGLDVRDVARQAGRSDAYVSKRIRVFEDATLRTAVERDQIPVSVIEELLTAPGPARAGLLKRLIGGGWDRARLRDEVRSAIEEARGQPSGAPPEDTDIGTVERRGAEPGPSRSTANDRDFVQQVRSLTRALQQVRPYELTALHEQALAELLSALLRLARAHTAQGGQGGPVFPSLEEAARATRRQHRA